MSVTITKQSILDLIETIQCLYQADEIPWMIGYSGGKDSTTALQLVWTAISRLPEESRFKPVYVMNTNTLVESPIIINWVENSLRKMEEAARENKLPFIITRLIPDVKDTYWVSLIGKGYPYPRKKFRWCTDRLKIRPVNNFIKERISQYGEVILVLGTRKAESARRAKSMNRLEKKRIRELLSPNPTLANELVFSPLEDWTSDDVWTYLTQYKNPWGCSNFDLLTLYRGATADNECPIIMDQSQPSCGNSRFGCWVCTMVQQDKSMEAMITNDQEKAWLSPLLEFRNEFASNDDIDRNRREFRKLSGKLRGSYQRLHHGPYKQETRESWLRRLLEVQKEIQEKGPEEFKHFKLITIPELQEIRRIWTIEKHEFCDSVPRIYKEVTGLELPEGDRLSYGNLKKEEWDLLKETVTDLFPEEELAFEAVYSMLDVENSMSSESGRKKVQQELATVLNHTFYQNEEDALAFYQKKNEQKKDLGGKYDERFLDLTSNVEALAVQENLSPDLSEESPDHELDEEDLNL